MQIVEPVEYNNIIVDNSKQIRDFFLLSKHFFFFSFLKYFFLNKSHGEINKIMQCMSHLIRVNSLFIWIVLFLSSLY